MSSRLLKCTRSQRHHGHRNEATRRNIYIFIILSTYLFLSAVCVVLMQPAIDLSRIIHLEREWVQRVMCLRIVSRILFYWYLYFLFCVISLFFFLRMSYSIYHNKLIHWYTSWKLKKYILLLVFFIFYFVIIFFLFFVVIWNLVYCCVLQTSRCGRVAGAEWGCVLSGYHAKNLTPFRSLTTTTTRKGEEKK